jgi:hypothetical protein
MPILVNPKKPPAPATPAAVERADPTAELLEKVQSQNQEFLTNLGEMLAKQGKRVIEGKVIRNKESGLIESFRLETDA